MPKVKGEVWVVCISLIWWGALGSAYDMIMKVKSV